MDTQRRSAPRLAGGRATGVGMLAAVLTAAAMVTLNLGLPGCASEHRDKLTEQQLEERRTADITEATDALARGTEELVVRMTREDDDYRAGRTTEPPILDILAISGGGDWGAFGAGFLVGWKRPVFDIVSGVSTGALLAPFAYVGTDEACQFVEDFYRNPKKDWVASRNLLFFLPHLKSFMVIPGLERDIRAAVTPEFVAEVAAGRDAGRLLAVSATNLDLAAQRVWLLGKEAQLARDRNDTEKFCRILLASAAIPAVFPPVEIDGFLYADGGVTANVLLRLDPDSPQGFINIWRRKHSDRPVPRVRYWVLVNNQLRPPPLTVEPRWPAIIVPSLNTSTRSATIAEVRWLATEAALANATLNTDIEVRLASIPLDWRAPVEGSFKKETMVSLADLGRRCGADPDFWTLLTAPKVREVIPTDPTRIRDVPAGETPATPPASER